MHFTAEMNKGPHFYRWIFKFINLERIGHPIIWSKSRKRLLECMDVEKVDL
jgi:hypothetical protein